jgi:O-antigen/teichoic acid export membrane protein
VKNLIQIRHLGYVFWTVAESAIDLGASRLVLFPLVAYIIGAEAFGIFITAYSMIMMLGNAPAGGISMGVLRHITEYPEDEQAVFHSTAVTMCHRLMLIIAGVILLSITSAKALNLGSNSLLICLAALSVSLYADNQYEVILARLRVDRKFRQKTLWMGLRTLFFMTGGITGALLYGVKGFALGFAAGNILGFVFLRMSFNSGRELDKNMARLLMKTWLHMTVASILNFSALYVSRIILSFFGSYTDVSDYYSATCVISIFLIPVTCGSTLLMSMLSRFKSMDELSRKAKLFCVISVVASAILFTAFIVIFGNDALKIMFPKFGDNARKLMLITNWALPFAVVFLAIRPFLVKFAPIHYVPISNGLISLGFILPAIMLIPRYGSTGAAWAFLCGTILSAVIVLAAFVYVNVNLKNMSREISC